MFLDKIQGYKIPLYNNSTFPKTFQFAGVFVGIKDGVIVSAILSDDIAKAIEKTPNFNSFAWTNVGNESDNYKLFNEILRVFKPRYIYNYISEKIQTGQFTVSNRDEIAYNYTTNQLMIPVKILGMRTIWINVPGYRICEVMAVEHVVYPGVENVEDIENLKFDKGSVLFEGYNIPFNEFFDYHFNTLNNLKRVVKWYDICFHNMAIASNKKTMFSKKAS